MGSSEKKPRRKDLYDAFNKSVGESADFARKRQFDKDLKKAYKELAPCFDLDSARVCSFFKDDRNPEEEIRHAFAGTGLDNVFFYDKGSIAKFSEVFKDSFLTSGLWKFLIECRNKVESPIVVFKVKNNGLWVLSLYKGRFQKSLKPRVVFPTTMADVGDPYLYSLDSFVKDNTEIV